MNFSFSTLLPIGTLIFVVSIALYYIWALMPHAQTVEWIHLKEKFPFSFSRWRYPIGIIDVGIAVVIILFWTVFSFFNLGDNEAPQSFHRFETEYVVIDLGKERTIETVRYYTGLNTGEYALYFSADGEEWTNAGEMPQRFSQLFQWRTADITPTSGVRYIRLGARTPGLYLGELALYEAGGVRIDSMHLRLTWSDPRAASAALFDEQSLIPTRASFLNSMYFDEIYHGRTAFEHTLQMDPYEISHPPLGKLIISIGIHLFGMTAFGWRVAGAFSGALILGIFFLVAKNLFGKRLLALAGTLIFASSFMHFSQTRIATIDTYSVLFVLLQFWFMYRYVSLDHETPISKTLPSLGLAGLFFGLGAAAKWTSLYFAPAMVVFWVMYQIFRWKHMEQKQESLSFKRFFKEYLGYKILASTGFFVIIPLLIYYLSYIPYGQAAGISFFSGDFARLVWENQVFMFSYHAHDVLGASHPFTSSWWMWIFNIRPILYYRSTMPNGLISTISSFGNPLVYWAGFLAIFAMLAPWHKKGDGRAFMIFIGYFSLLLPWVFIDRITFAYHYFTNSLFLVLAITYCFNQLIHRGRGYYQAVILSFTTASVGLFVLFYPVLSGRPVSLWFIQNVLTWLPTWTF